MAWLALDGDKSSVLMSNLLLLLSFGVRLFIGAAPPETEAVLLESVNVEFTSPSTISSTSANSAQVDMPVKPRRRL